MTEPLTVPSRYCGPPTSANGGYAAGALAQHLTGADGETVTVSLRRPPPLDVPMDVAVEGRSATLSYDGSLVAEAAHSDQDVDPVEPVSYEEALAASARYPGLRFHPFPTCFSCGTERPDGLRIFPGEVEPAGDGAVRVAAPWTPEPDATLATAWAALDCAGGWAGDLADRLMVLARITATVDALPRVGEPHVVMGQRVSVGARKTLTSSTLHDSDGRVVALAAHVWVAVDPAVFGGVSPGAAS